MASITNRKQECHKKTNNNHCEAYHKIQSKTNNNYDKENKKESNTTTTTNTIVTNCIRRLEIINKYLFIMVICALLIVMIMIGIKSSKSKHIKNYDMILYKSFVGQQQQQQQHQDNMQIVDYEELEDQIDNMINELQELNEEPEEPPYNSKIKTYLTEQQILKEIEIEISNLKNNTANIRTTTTEQAKLINEKIKLDEIMKYTRLKLKSIRREYEESDPEEKKKFNHVIIYLQKQLYIEINKRDEIKTKLDNLPLDLDKFCVKCIITALRTSCAKRKIYLMEHNHIDKDTAKESVMRMFPECIIV